MPTATTFTFPMTSYILISFYVQNSHLSKTGRGLEFLFTDGELRLIIFSPDIEKQTVVGILGGPRLKLNNMESCG